MESFITLHLRWAIVLLLTPLVANAQESETLKERILSLEDSQRNIQVNLERSHKQFSTGTLFLIGGIVTSAMTAITYDRGVNSSDFGRGKFNPALVYVSAGLFTIGTVIQIDSHKWIGRAGKRKKRE